MNRKEYKYRVAVKRRPSLGISCVAWSHLHADVASKLSPPQGGILASHGPLRSSHMHILTYGKSHQRPRGHLKD